MNQNLQILVRDLGLKAKNANSFISNISSQKKNNVLQRIGKIIWQDKELILKENRKDLLKADKNAISKSKRDRVLLTEDRLQEIISGLDSIANQKDPVGQVVEQWDRPSGISIKKITTPIGVVGIIYESRPNVTIDAGALCIKSGNAAILRSGSDSFLSSIALHNCIKKALILSDLPEELIQIIPTRDRKAVSELLQMSEYLDVAIPRGGKDLVRLVQNIAKVPVFSHLDGIVHCYVHSDAKPDMAESVIINSKLRRPGICGALECLLINRDYFLSMNGQSLLKSLIDKGVEIRGDNEVTVVPGTIPAMADDWGKEFLDKILAVKIVDGVQQAISHIKRFGSNHTDCIITNDDTIAQTFFNELDSAILMQNVSTQFADGGEFGMGAEIGIGTGKLHARGPIGANQLTSFKYIVQGNGVSRK
ncbi:MAG: glutamate-5-semialdehyde dehydrogenase [Paracoccaceae bacterium]|nr:glutamate-5-semialdehyde dehydrogenase [Paracoccaceae bacterium]